MGLGTFLLVVAVLATVWIPGVVKKTPTDVNTTTYLSGEAQRLDAETGKLGDVVPVNIQSVTQTDSAKSNGDVVVWRSGTCVVVNVDGDAPACVDGKDPRLLTASEDAFATDRVTGIAVQNGKYVPAGTVQHEGLMNKWPFDAEKKTYPYWDGTVGAAVDAVYQGTEELGGVETYRYQINIDEAPIEIADGVNGTYTNAVNIYVEPKTGAILNQSQDQQQYLENGTQVLDLQVEFTKDQKATSASDAEANKSKLNLLTKVVPIIGFVGGILALLAGLALIFIGRGRRREGVDLSKPATGSH